MAKHAKNYPTLPGFERQRRQARISSTLRQYLRERRHLIARDMIALLRDHRVYSTLAAMCNRCISAFSCVSDSFNCKMPFVKSNKLYRDYSDSLRIASMIMRRQDIAISQRDSRPDELVPVFRIDMALLFEHYALALMRRTFGHGAVQYQVAGYSGRFYADFLLTAGSQRFIIDAKYIDEPNRQSPKPTTSNN